MDLLAISLFSGAGGLDIAARQAGIRTLVYVENDPYAQAILMSRIRDGILDDGAIWDDVRTFDGRPFNGKVDCVFGGFPCQPHSIAGERRGASDSRNLWPEMLRIVKESEAPFVLGENVPGIFDTGYAIEVLASLEESGYCSTPVSISACEIGAPHPRERVFFMAHASSLRCRPWCKLERSSADSQWGKEATEWKASHSDQLAGYGGDRRNFRRVGKKR